MALELYSHNLREYKAAAAMLEQSGKAAVIHPTGTGKSFIAFQLIAGHPEASFLRLSPNEHIFQTQCESLRRTDPEVSLEKLKFFTYAKLSMLTEEDLNEQEKTDYIILDEFHHCETAGWGQGVSRLLEVCKNAKVLGLSATNVRYLDNQRDMAEELFDGCITSEMTLGETIVRGDPVPANRETYCV